MEELKNLEIELTNLGLTGTPYPDLDLERFNQLHRPVGKIELYSLKERVNDALAELGYEERVTEAKFRSVYTPEMLVVPLIKFCEGSKFQPRNKRVFRRAVENVRKKLNKATVRPISLSEAYQLLMMDKADHFAGLPTMGKKADDSQALMRAEQCWEGKCPPPPIIGHRGKNTEVVRAVWMFPFEWHIVEASFYYPLFSIIKSKQTIYPVGALSERRYTMRKYDGSGKYNTKFSIDYSGFDASLNTQMIGVAFNILSSMLDLDEHQSKVWGRIQTYFSTCPFLAPDGLVYKGRRGGVPSGSMFTQLVDSICNAVAIEYAMLSEGVTDYRYLVYGDDSWTICDIGEEPQSFLSKISAHVRSLGLRMNVLKTESAAPGEAILFCGHYDIRRGRPLQDAVDKLCYPERPSQTFRTSEGLRERLIAYMADSDHVVVFNLVYQSLLHHRAVSYMHARHAETELYEMMHEGVCTSNRRNLPGIMQIMDMDPADAASFMKIRAAM